jgi:hypothetical protein
VANHPPTDGAAGASARREHERRKARREEEVLRRHPRAGTLLLAVSEAPQHERRWAHGAGGEELVAEALSKRCSDTVRVLHDRRMPGSRANIDHLAIAPSGVWVVDTKRYAGKIRVAKPLLRAARLEIGGRDRTKLVDGLARQVDAVRAAVADLAPGTAVHGALCFVEGICRCSARPRSAGFRCSIAGRWRSDSMRPDRSARRRSPAWPTRSSVDCRPRRLSPADGEHHLWCSRSPTKAAGPVGRC